MQHIDSLKARLNTPCKIVITTHDKPDADALGSSLGMARYLLKKGHLVNVITPSDYPSFLHWMKGNDEILIFGEATKERCATLIEKADVIIALDFSVLSRINELEEPVKVSRGFKVNVDHHLNPEDFADFRLWNTEAAATCELCYELIVALGDEELIDKDIAECLYAGIMTDTGGFRHPNTTQNVHEVVARLIAHGADNSTVAKNIYDRNSEDRLRFLGYALHQNLQVMKTHRVAYFALSEAELKAYHTKTGDTEGLVNHALSIEGITLAGMFKQSGEIVKVSLRSIGQFPANEVAAKYFNGGGHRNAAGGRYKGTLAEAVMLFKEVLNEYKIALEKENQIN